ncbi:acetyl-CoA carboxylase biotin carboxyl carrier protein [Enterococcus columbae]|uniref:Biotin carboxyl carrier protein of acetyl-CoA carboxylase n=1 Tax=Enterococcus columbae DSM 7374 = ATCC 51263 TaxID=1121865 RepID=S0KE02_9ENTE|nr:acetyl-CoA carboxylase biotin carboxyl carrier protein [Enterococcus columbae]EOT42892.1 acetyl-CoA carboxylase, biotin carboxyl carrier protein [Enterococcus columbae DSM 7374 = ATCC 51263]EOW87671.1 acetyl-CoA carboxylase, biotin carboxyl carrier protein [Enterococcus columbae DSM 7374 = ATCC 51263]OJG24670.1 acetyl-CoA carboxylase, biotin carboxyl carrier protein [Enterococcus columbae DSM 7374 = ATCC 51263]
MQLNEVKELFQMFEQSALTEFDLKQGSFELYLSKNKQNRGQQSILPTGLSYNEAMPVAEMQEVSTSAQAVVEKKKDEVAKEVSGTPIVSPLVGVAYLKPAPDKPEFKQVGDRVQKGEVVCIIEAMKVMNEITSDVSGEIVEILVENEQMVEYNQPLFKVKEG